MSATPPGVDELDPVDLDPTGLDAQPGDPTDEADPKVDPLTSDVPPATPQGHHQTHSMPVDVN